MKLKVGMYVSTTDRKEIGKITHFCECEYCKERGYLEPIIDNPNIFITIYDKENKFHGYKFYDTPMDLIQVGDYVNGYVVLDKQTDNLGEKYIECGCKDEKAYDYVYDTFYNKDIKTIVTKEQMEAIQYKAV